MAVILQNLPTGQLLQTYRELVAAAALKRDDADIVKKADLYEEEIMRRMAW